ncbi:MAG: DHA2 family efflux MFS transporter permease subunit [Thermodesulfobacteriota bacterium]
MPPRQVNKWIITLSVMIPTLIEILDTSVANVALDHMRGSLSAGQEEVTWVLTSYLVANAVVIPMSGWLARFMGRKRYLLASLVLFTVSSLLCGAATSLAQLVFFRVIQGVGGGGLQPMSQAILLETFPPHERGMAMAVFGMGVVVGPILGPLLGGWLTDAYSWRWIFYINLPIGILALAMNWAFVHDPDYMERRASGEKVDYVGLALLCLGIGSLQIVLDKGQIEDWFNSGFIVALSAVAAVCLVALVFWELAHERPILNLRAFANRSFAMGNLFMFMGFFAFFGSIVLLPLFLQTLMGYTAYLAGVVLGPGGCLAILVMPVVGKLTQRLDARLLIGVGMGVTAWSLYYMSGFTLHIDFATAVTGRIIQGLGMPFFFVAVTFATMATVPREQMNNASAIYNLLRNLGGSFGVAFVTTLLARRTQHHHSVLSEHMSPLDPGFSLRLDALASQLAARLGEFADTTGLALGAIYREMNRQAAALAYADAFLAQALIFVGLMGLIWIMRRPPVGAPPGADAGH